MKSDQPDRIMLVEPQPESLEVLLSALVTRFNAHITCVSTAAECLDVEAVDPHDLVISEFDLPDTSGLTLADELAALRARPTILLADDPSAEDAIEAMRVGVRDMLVRPFATADLLDAAEIALEEYGLHSQHQHRHQRLRDLLKHVIRQRRQLRERTELVCRDLVGAHRRLVERVLEYEELRGIGG